MCPCPAPNSQYQTSRPSPHPKHHFSSQHPQICGQHLRSKSILLQEHYLDIYTLLNGCKCGLNGLINHAKYRSLNWDELTSVAWPSWPIWRMVAWVNYVLGVEGVEIEAYLGVGEVGGIELLGVFEVCICSAVPVVRCLISTTSVVSIGTLLAFSFSSCLYSASIL